MSDSTTITGIMWRNNNAPGQAAVYGPDWTGFVDTADGTCTVVHVTRHAERSRWLMATSSRDGHIQRGFGRTLMDAVSDLLAQFEVAA